MLATHWGNVTSLYARIPKRQGNDVSKILCRSTGNDLFYLAEQESTCDYCFVSTSYSSAHWCESSLCTTIVKYLTILTSG